jgi:hypothetical protein
VLAASLDDHLAMSGISLTSDDSTHDEARELVRAAGGNGSLASQHATAVKLWREDSAHRKILKAFILALEWDITALRREREAAVEEDLARLLAILGAPDYVVGRHPWLPPTPTALSRADYFGRG